LHFAQEPTAFLELRKGHDVIARGQGLLASIGVLDAIAYPAAFTQFMLDQVPLTRMDSRVSGSPYDNVLSSN